MITKLAKLGDVAEINPQKPKIKREEEKKTSFIPMENVDGVNGVVRKLYEKSYSQIKKGYTYFEENDVIFAKITPCMQNGKHAVVIGLIDGIGFGSTEFHIIRASNKITPEWIHYFLRRKETLNAAVKTFTGAVGHQRVPESFIENLELPLPPTTMQRKIVTDLKSQFTEVDKMRKAVELQFTDMRLLRSRTLVSIFSQFDKISKKKIGEFAVTTSGSTPARSNKDYWESAEVPWVKTAEVVFKPIVKTEEHIAKQALVDCSLKLLPPKTVLIAMYGQGKTRGQSAILEIAATTNQACFAILPNDTWEPEFLYLWLVRSYQDLRDLSEDRGGNQANLNGALLKGFEVPAPTRKKQLEIVEKINSALKEIDAMQKNCESTLSDINNIPNRLLAQAFEI